MNRCRYKGASGDTVNVVWATLAWNTKKVVHLHQQKEEKQILDETGSLREIIPKIPSHPQLYPGVKERYF